MTPRPSGGSSSGHLGCALAFSPQFETACVVFPRLFVFVLLVFFPLPQTHAVVERTIERTFPVANRAIVNVDTFYGSIQVLPSDRSDVRVLIRQSLDASTDADAERQLRNFEFVLEGTPDGRVTLAVRSRKSVRWTWDKWPPIGLVIEISVPWKCDLDLVSREGPLMVGNLQGKVNLRAEQGPVFVAEVDGAVTIWSARGDVSVTACTGPLDITARMGNVVVGRARGGIQIFEAGGAVEIQAAHGPLRVHAAGSDLKVGFAHPLRGGAELRSSGGDVVVSFDPASAAVIEARASAFGKVSARGLQLAVRSGSLGSSRVEADLMSGGPRVVIRAASGNIRLLSVPSTLSDSATK